MVVRAMSAAARPSLLGAWPGFPDSWPLPVLFIVCALGLGILATLPLLWDTARVRRRTYMVRGYATAHGWQPVTEPDPDWKPDPALYGFSSRFQRCHLALSTRIGERTVMMAWFWGIQPIPPSSYAPRNDTRYLVQLPAGYPDMQVRRRNRIAALVHPVQGVGTADPLFDRAFSTYSAAAARLLTPRLRQAMLDGWFPAWEISDGMLITEYEGWPSIENLYHRAEIIDRIAEMLTDAQRHRRQGDHI